MTKRPHVEHDWKDRTLKLMERTKEMQERIDNLNDAVKEEAIEKAILNKRIYELIDNNEETYSALLKSGYIITASLIANIALAWALIVRF